MSHDVDLRKVLARHREDPPPSLDFSLAIHHQLDQEFCTAVTEMLGENGASWEKLRATPTLWNQIPAECGLYMFVFESSLALEAEDTAFRPAWVLYVGRAGSAESTRTLKDRYKEEYSKYVSGSAENLWASEYPRTRAQKLSKYLTMFPLQYWFATIQNRAAIPDLEDRLIKLLSPPLNTHQQPRVRRHAEEPAFRSPG